jgi:hypothetical protein
MTVPRQIDVAPNVEMLCCCEEDMLDLLYRIGHLTIIFVTQNSFRCLVYVYLLMKYTFLFKTMRSFFVMAYGVSKNGHELANFLLCFKFVHTYRKKRCSFAKPFFFENQNFFVP